MSGRISSLKTWNTDFSDFLFFVRGNFLDRGSGGFLDFGNSLSLLELSDAFGCNVAGKAAAMAEVFFKTPGMFLISEFARAVYCSDRDCINIHVKLSTNFPLLGQVYKVASLSGLLNDDPSMIDDRIGLLFLYNKWIACLYQLVMVTGGVSIP